MNSSKTPECRWCYYSVALIAGGTSGLVTDLVLFPIDTTKTRLQSASGFKLCGGFKGIYAGIGAAAVSSVPSAALFFCTYEAVKQISGTYNHLPVVHMLASSFGEMVACLVRVPSEVVKQRAQTSPHKSSLIALRTTLAVEGLRGLYRGYRSTVLREIPFSAVQFPLWELFKKYFETDGQLANDKALLSGALAGGIAAALTTPLDVAKTRIMLAKSGSDLAKGNILHALKVVYASKGFHGLYAGIIPRSLWMTTGGAIFLGIYETSSKQLLSYFSDFVS